MSRLLSLLFPSAGLVLSGRIVAGLTWGLLFAIVANCAIVMWAIIPAEFSPAIRGVALLMAVCFYAAPLLLGRSPPPRPKLASIHKSTCLSVQERRVALTELVRAMDEGASADDAARKLRDAAETDLHVAFRLAQYAEFAGDSREAANAWQRLQSLDRHGIYRRENTRIGDQ